MSINSFPWHCPNNLTGRQANKKMAAVTWHPLLKTNVLKAPKAVPIQPGRKEGQTDVLENLAPRRVIWGRIMHAKSVFLRVGVSSSDQKQTDGDINDRKRMGGGVKKDGQKRIFTSLIFYHPKLWGLTQYFKAFTKSTEPRKFSAPFSFEVGSTPPSMLRSPNPAPSGLPFIPGLWAGTPQRKSPPHPPRVGQEKPAAHPPESHRAGRPLAPLALCSRVRCRHPVPPSRPWQCSV